MYDHDEDVIDVGDDTMLHRSSRDRKGKSKVNDEPILEGQAPPAVPMPPGFDMPIRRKTMPDMDPSANIRGYQQRRQEEDIVMVDTGGPSENPVSPGLKRSDSNARKSGFGGMFGGFLSKKDRPDLKRRSTAPPEDDRGARRDERERKVRRSTRDVEPDITMSGGAVEEDQEARRAARRARRAEREAGQRGDEAARAAKEELRRERQRREEDALEARRQAEHDARRAAKREKRKLAEEAEERAERRRARKEQTDGEDRARRRRSHRDTERREDRVRPSDTRRSSHRKSVPVVEEPEYLPADGPVYQNSNQRRTSAWPHSGTDSWVKDHSDAPPPPVESPVGEGVPADDMIADENERRRLRKTRPQGDDDERRRRRDERRRERDTAKTAKSSEDSQGDGLRQSNQTSGFETSRTPSATGGIFSRWRRFGG